jgi:hypothetical protein
MYDYRCTRCLERTATVDPAATTSGIHELAVQVIHNSVLGLHYASSPSVANLTPDLNGGCCHPSHFKGALKYVAVYPCST